MQGTAAVELSPGSVVLDLTEDDAATAIRRIANALAGDASVTDLDGFCRDVLAREEACATATSHGVAFPHARTDNVSGIVLAAGRCREAIRFGDRDVRLIFLIGTPLEMVGEYLGLVGRLAKLLRDETLRARLLNAKTPGEFVGALRDAGE